MESGDLAVPAPTPDVTDDTQHEQGARKAPYRESSANTREEASVRSTTIHTLENTASKHVLLFELTEW